MHGPELRHLFYMLSTAERRAALGMLYMYVFIAGIVCILP
jgi:hypothetical protein